MKLTGFVGPSYTLDSVNVDCQRCVNLYPEIIESGTGKDAQTLYLKHTPGLELLLTVGAGPIRCVHTDSAGHVFVISGSQFYNLVFSGGVWVAILQGTLSTSTGHVIAATMDPGTDRYTVFVDGNNNYLYSYPASGVEQFGTFAAFAYPPLLGATHVDYLDGYLIYVVPTENKFYVSDFNTVFVNALSFATSEGNPDKVLALIVSNRYLYVFNEKSTEVYTNTGSPDFPLERVSGGYVEKGILAPYSVARLEGTVFWLARDELGQGSIYAMSGISPQRISTHAIERAINGFANPAAAKAYTYSKNGHSFYVLNFSETSFVYDLATKLWHERCYLDNTGNLIRHRANYSCYVTKTATAIIGVTTPQSIHLVGDYATNKIYLLKDNVYSDNGDAIARVRTSPHISNELKNIFYNSLQIDMETGIGLASGLGSDPQVVMTYSNDGGHTWSSEAAASAGTSSGGIGLYKTRVIWRRLGRARDRVFKVKITDPVPVTIISAEIEYTLGDR